MLKKIAPPDASEIRTLMDVAMGRVKADLVISGGDLVNVYTGEILEGWSVAIKGERIAYVGDNPGHTIGFDTEVIDASGKILIPGLIDAHTHLFMYYTVSEFLRYAMTGGTTTIIAEALEIAFPLGYEGLLEYLESAGDQPVKLFATAPPMPTLSPHCRPKAMDVETLQKLLKRDDILGLGETPWSCVVNGSKLIFDLFAETLASGKRLEGHSAGARGKKLVSYVATGISSCHESTTVEELLERLRLGLWTMIREGDIRAELPAVSGIKDHDIDFRRLILVSDGIVPKRLMADGYMEYVVQRAIDFGFDPIVAIQMATLNPAEHFRLDHSIGGMAPSRLADIVIIPDIRSIKAEYVISNGRIIAKDGSLIVQPRSHNFSKKSFPSIQIQKKLSASDFTVSVDPGTDPVRVRIIDQITELITREAQVNMACPDGKVKADVDRDILKVAAITETDAGTKIFTGFIRGVGIKKGAFATTAVWDACAMLIVGSNDEDMAEAANRVVSIRGGIVVCVDGRVMTELPLPIGGLVSDESMETIARRIDDIHQALGRMGCPLLDPHLTLTTLTTPFIPFFRMSEEGVVDLKEGRGVDLVVAL
jgi:adenine deaminase